MRLPHGFVLGMPLRYRIALVLWFQRRSLVEIGKNLGVSRQRAEQIIDSALDKLVAAYHEEQEYKEAEAEKLGKENARKKT